MQRHPPPTLLQVKKQTLRAQPQRHPPPTPLQVKKQTLRAQPQRHPPPTPLQVKKQTLRAQMKMKKHLPRLLLSREKIPPERQRPWVRKFTHSIMILQGILSGSSSAGAGTIQRMLIKRFGREPGIILR